MINSEEVLLFRFVPTMRCNFRCEYCFLSDAEKQGGSTMFDDHSPEEWIEGMTKYSDYKIEPYLWGGEPFCIDGTYEILREWVKMEHIVSGLRIDTNVFYAYKIAEKCPSSKIKLNCSFHMQYHSLEEEIKKVKCLKELDMIGMVNFVASEYNISHLRNDYGMNTSDLIETFAEMDVFVNIAGDFAITNNPKHERYEEYKKFILQFISEDEWCWLRGINGQRMCTAGQKMFTVNHNGDFTSCLDGKIRGNFFEGTLVRDTKPEVCNKSCQSLVSYPFRCDNDFPTVNSLQAYVDRNKAYRSCTKSELKDFTF